jgi:hypothetical protein
MRVELNNNVDARIIIGGRMTKYSGRIPGVVEEAMLALFSDKPTYLIGSFGGAASHVANALHGEHPKQLTKDWQIADQNYKDFFSYYNKEYPNDKIDYSAMVAELNSYGLKRYALNNGLTEEENERLFNSLHLPESIFLTLKGLFAKLG